MKVDEEEARYQAERRKEAIERAKTLLYHQTDRAKHFHVRRDVILPLTSSPLTLTPCTPTLTLTHGHRELCCCQKC